MALHKLAHLNTPKMFRGQFKYLSIPKNLGTLKTNFEAADGLGINLTAHENITHSLHGKMIIYAHKCLIEKKWI